MPLEPKSQDELGSTIANVGEPLLIQGHGTKQIGHDVAGSVVSLRNFSSIEIYEPEELILEAGAATPMSEINALVASRHQMLAFEPPDYSSLYGTSSAGTLGGVVACGLSGPRRIKAGAVRDHVLGVTGVTGNGLAFKSGARVVKNVTGYDLPKLLTGSHGTLAALTSIIVKVLPLPETEETVVLRGLDDVAAVRVMSDALQSAAEVSAAAHVPGEGTYLRLEGIAPSVAARRDLLIKLLRRDAGIVSAGESAALWQGLRDAAFFWPLQNHCIWRISVAPMDAPALVAQYHQALDCRHVLDWGGGLIWLAVKDTDAGGASVVRGALKNGHATLMRAPDSVKTRVPVFQPQLPALAALSIRVKQAFDPRGILNRGRMGF